MDPLARAVEAADGPWPVIAIAVLGIYVLAWRFGNQLLVVARENNVVAKQAHAETRQISQSIVTNHGSKNLGDAVDRITEWMLLHMEESRANAESVKHDRTELLIHLASQDVALDAARTAIGKLDERMSAVEQKKAG